MAMYQFQRHHRVSGCRKALERVDPEALVNILDFFPVGSIKRKGGKLVLTYVYDPNSRFGGKAKTEVTVDRGSNHLRIRGLGPLSFEVRLSCPQRDRLLVYMTVTGKLLPMVSRETASKIFEELDKAVMEMVGVEKAEQPAAPQTPALAPSTTPQPAAPVLAVGYTAPAPSQPAQPVQQLQPVAVQPPSPVTGVGLSEPATKGAGAKERVEEAYCLVRLVTAGFPLDDELSRRIPRDYSPLVRSPGAVTVVDSGVRAVQELNFLEYDDADYIIRLGVGGSRADIVRLPGKGVVGVYYRGPEGEAYGLEAAKRIVREACSQETRVAYWVLRLNRG